LFHAKEVVVTSLMDHDVDWSVIVKTKRLPQLYKERVLDITLFTILEGQELAQTMSKSNSLHEHRIRREFPSVNHGQRRFSPCTI
jgi:hypothetical protein